MKMLILNGSPAGKNSITLQTMEYLKILFGKHEYETIHVGQMIRQIEKDFSPSRKALTEADLIVFCYPVYTFLVPAQLHRFIELIKENKVDLCGKYVTQITTSKHFYDITAHRFIEDNCRDLKMRYIRGLSADMEDLLSEKGQKEAEAFFRFVVWNMENGFSEKECRTESSADFTGMKASLPAEETARKPFFVSLVTDHDPADADTPLLTMICRFAKRFPGEVRIINLREFPFAGGCLGCFHCAVDGTCIYKDGFDDFLRKNINSADAVVYAYTIKDHSMGFRMKLFDDRQFCNGHRTVTMGKPVGYLVDGDLSEEENLRMVMEARAQVGGNFPAGVADNASDPDEKIDQLAMTLFYAIQNSYTMPATFYGVGGMKIFRDLIWQMQGLMKEDHRFYKEHGFYDFPQKRKGTIAGMYLVSLAMNHEKLRKKVNMTEGMLMAYRNVIRKAEKKRKNKK